MIFAWFYEPYMSGGGFCWDNFSILDLDIFFVIYEIDLVKFLE
jgi:hypothetical protein